MVSVPLGELCDLLRADGFTIGVDHHVRIGRLLARDIGWTPEMLRTALAAIVVTDPGERKRFDACWERWLAGAEPPPPPSPPLRPVLPAPASARWPRFAGAIAVAASVAIGAMYYVGGGPGGDPVGDPIEGGAVQPGSGPGSAGGSSSGSQAHDREAPRPLHTGWPEPRAPEWIAAFVALAAGAALLVLVTASAVIAARMRRRLLPGPWRYLLAVPPGTRHEPVLSQAAIEHAVADLTWLGSAAGPELDVPRSVANAVERGGFATPVYRRGLAAPRYVVLEDTAGGADRWRFLYDELLDGLAGEGFEIARYTFAANLDHLRSRDGDVVALGPVIDHAEAVIVIGGGDGAINALTGERARWLTALQHVPRRLWINPFPPARWSAGARAIAADIPMEHGVARAFTAVRVGVDRHGGADQIFPAVIERSPGTVSATRALREAIGPRAFQLLAAIAVLGPPTISLARWIVERHARRFRDLRERDWLAVVTLPWFRAQAWPDGMRDRLCAALRTLNPPLARRLTRDSGELFAGGEPAPGCGAHLAWRLDGARRAWLRGERRTAARELRRLTWTPLFRQARGAMAALGVRDHVRTALALGLVIGSLLVGSAAGDLAHARAAWEERRDERHLVKLAGDGTQLVPPTGTAWPDVFAVRVVDGNGAAVAGAHVVWSDPTSGPRSYIEMSGADGRSAAPQLYASAPRVDREQVAQLITSWNGAAQTDQPVPADGERVTFRFAQVDPATPGPCADAISRRQWAALQDCASKLADPVQAQTLQDTARRELAHESDVADVQRALNAGDLKKAEASLQRIDSDSVYLTELRDAFGKAEDQAIARVRPAAQRYADARDCRGLRDYIVQMASSTTARVAAVLRAVSCVDVPTAGGGPKPPAPSAPDARCATLDLSAIKDQALDLYNASNPREALAMVRKAISCGIADATLYRHATEYACSANDAAGALQLFAHVDAASRKRVLEFCRSAHVDLLRAQCDTVDVDELMAQAKQRYADGVPQEALELAVRALACKQNTAMYQAAAMFACAAHDQASARRYFAEVPAERQSGIVQKCVDQGLQLP